MLYIVESKKSIEEIQKAFPEAAAKEKFGVLGVHDLRQKMNEKGVAFDRDVRVFEVCNPQQAKKVLEKRMEISTALPCRVSIYREGDKTKIAAILPTALIGLFGSPELAAVAEEVEFSLKKIMDSFVEEADPDTAEVEASLKEILEGPG